MRTLQLNQTANNDLKGQTFPTAMEKYLEALRYDPFVSALHLNLGLSFEGLQQAEKALASYKEAETLALKEQNQELVFMARFNQAQLLGKAKRIDEALALYQKALEIIPSSKEVKTNIELLTQGEGGGGGGENQKDQKDQSGDQQKDQNKDGQGDQNKDKEQDQEQKDDKKEMKQSPKYKPRPFEGKELSEADVKKILGELKQQEEKIRAEYNKKEMKEQPRDKDW